MDDAVVRIKPKTEHRKLLAKINAKKDKPRKEFWLIRFFKWLKT